MDTDFIPLDEAVSDEAVAEAEQELLEDIRHHLAWTATHRPGRDVNFCLEIARQLNAAAAELIATGAVEAQNDEMAG